MHWTIARYGESQCGALFEKVRQKVEYFLEKGDESDAPAGWSTFIGESQCGALFKKVRQKVEYFLKKGDESDAPADREFLGLMQR